MGRRRRIEDAGSLLEEAGDGRGKVGQTEGIRFAGVKAMASVEDFKAGMKALCFLLVRSANGCSGAGVTRPKAD